MIALAYTGGLDSYLAYRYAQKHELEVLPFHVDLGHPYAGNERAVIQNQGVKCLVVDLPVMKSEWYNRLDSHIIPGRNLILAVVGANFGSEVWICAVAGERHPFSNRDKSPEWFHATSAALSYSWQPLRPETTVTAPFGNMTKAQTVEAALRQFDVTEDEIRGTHSCYETYLGCGQCAACFHRWIALALNGVEETYQKPPWESDRAKQELASMAVAERNSDFTYYSEDRIRETRRAMATKGAA